MITGGETLAGMGAVIGVVIPSGGGAPLPQQPRERQPTLTMPTTWRSD
jgi:hypothetical protein